MKFFWEALEAFGIFLELAGAFDSFCGGCGSFRGLLGAFGELSGASKSMREPLGALVNFWQLSKALRSFRKDSGKFSWPLACVAPADWASHMSIYSRWISIPCAGLSWDTQMLFLLVFYVAMLIATPPLGVLWDSRMLCFQAFQKARVDSNSSCWASWGPADTLIVNISYSPTPNIAGGIRKSLPVLIPRDFPFEHYDHKSSTITSFHH